MVLIHFQAWPYINDGAEDSIILPGIVLSGGGGIAAVRLATSHTVRLEMM